MDKGIKLAVLSLVAAVAVSGCVFSVTDYYQDDYYPLDREVVVVERPVVVRPGVICDRRPVCRDRRPVLVHGCGPVVVNEGRPVPRDYGPVVVRERPIVHRRVVVEEPPVVVRGHHSYRGPEVYHRRPTGAVVRHSSQHDRQTVASTGPPKTRGPIIMENFRPHLGRPQPAVVHPSDQSQAITVEKNTKSPSVGPPQTTSMPRHVESPSRD